MNQHIFINEHDDRNVSGTNSAAGGTNIIASPGQNYRIVVTSFLIQNESAVATTIILQDGPGRDAWRYRAQAQGDHLSKDFSDAHPWKLRKNQPLVMDLSGANQCGYSVQYYVEKA